MKNIIDKNLNTFSKRVLIKYIKYRLNLNLLFIKNIFMQLQQTT